MKRLCLQSESCTKYGTLNKQTIFIVNLFSNIFINKRDLLTFRFTFQPESSDIKKI